MCGGPWDVLCQWTKGQVGWRNENDTDGIPDAIDPNLGIYSEIPGTPPGSKVVIRLEGGEIAKSYMCTQDNVMWFEGRPYSIWDCTNDGGELVIPQTLYFNVDGGELHGVPLVMNPSDTPYVCDFSRPSEYQLQFRNAFAAYLLCRIRDSSGAVKLTPIFNKLLAPGTYSISLENLFPDDYVAVFTCWVPDGRSSTVNYDFTIVEHSRIPNAPSGLQCAANACRTIVVSWTDNSSKEDGFRIERRVGEGEFEPLAAVEANTTRYCDYVPSGETTCYYRVSAFNSNGSSQAPEEPSANTEADYPVHSTPLSSGSEVCGGLGLCGSPYVVNGACTVPVGAALTVESGVRIAFEAGASLTIRGTLNATGANFTSNSGSPQPGDWQGLVFTDGGSGTLTGCNVSYAERGVDVAGAYPSTVSSVVLEQCGFSHNLYAGVAGGDLSSVDAHDCTFSANGYGLNYHGRALHLRVEDCTFLYDESAAISVVNTWGYEIFPIIEDNTITNRSDYHEEGWQGVGVRMEGDVSGTFTGNTIQGFYDGVVLVTDFEPSGSWNVPLPSPFSDNTISGNTRYNLVAPQAGHEQVLCDDHILTAELNNWGLASRSEIEAKVRHCPDWNFLYFVDFDPWHIPPGCPYVYGWDGEEYVQENTVLGASGYSGGRTAVIDYLQLSHVKEDGGKVKLEIREFERERTELDGVELLAIDYPSSYSMLVSPDGKPGLYQGQTLPASVRDGVGETRLQKLLYRDGDVYQGDVGSSLVVEFVSVGEDSVFQTSSSGSEPVLWEEDLMMLAGGKPTPCEDDCAPPVGGVEVFPDFPTEATVQGASGSDYLGSDGSNGRGGILVQVPVTVFGRETWRTVARVLPREKLGELVLPGSVLGSARPSKLRFVWQGRHALDNVGFARIAAGAAGGAADAVKTANLALLSAQHSSRGDVRASVSRGDRLYESLDSGETIALEFGSGQPPPAENSRTYIVRVTGSYSTQSLEAAAAGEVPRQYSVKCNSANPFNPSVEIEYALPEEAKVVLKVYGVGGGVVKTLVQSSKPAGFHKVIWDGRDDGGTRAASGVYFLRLETESYTQTEKIVLLK